MRAVGTLMADSIRPIVEAFYRASARRDVDQVMNFIDDNADWILQGPIDVFAFFGQRHGKAAVLEGYREIAHKLDVTGYEVETLLVDGNRAAAMIRLSSIVRQSGRRMSVRTTQFSRWRDGKIVDMRAVCDTYDLVEQTLGVPLNGTASAGELVFA